jgi:hypothetical protein
MRKTPFFFQFYFLTKCLQSLYNQAVKNSRTLFLLALNPSCMLVVIHCDASIWTISVFETSFFSLLEKGVPVLKDTLADFGLTIIPDPHQRWPPSVCQDQTPDHSISIRFVHIPDCPHCTCQLSFDTLRVRIYYPC